ncbi:MULTISPECIES: DUF1656 domain-containing protein [Acinetobacter]|uniref:DUF1656 domain-containing protein n=1 Tax=Acinetobacter piscicola TaxID=2006115 RepID=A0A7S6VTY8_9GAMM|nr:MULTISPECIES: DUF1656 domain-containing protein [Acinetobacter]MDM1757936.1 DUF1656 domain-containing protein [Acinetobacter sp. 256-1]MDM1761351.1 DUF1656 domain-containing protein [Acinetobacter sp. 251-1]QOW44713.1 DUF1656 domain-containing protein [Acinetobacter piscicola]
MSELNIYGVYIPIFLVQAVIAYLLLKLINVWTDRWAEQGWIALPSIFNLCIYIVLLWGIHSLYVVYVS